MFVVVLNDGETYTALEGCVILALPDALGDEEVDEWVADNYINGTPVAAPKREGL